MARTTSGKVQGILGNDYDDETPLEPYVDSANSLTTDVSECAIDRGVTLSAAKLELIERWLSAYFYTRMDPIYQSKSTAGASAGFVQDTTATPERYKAGAIALDPSGCLKSLLLGARARIHWLGKPVSEQTDYVDRD